MCNSNDSSRSTDPTTRFSRMSSISSEQISLIQMMRFLLRSLRSSMGKIWNRVVPLLPMDSSVDNSFRIQTRKLEAILWIDEGILYALRLHSLFQNILLCRSRTVSNRIRTVNLCFPCYSTSLVGQGEVLNLNRHSIKVSRNGVEQHLVPIVH